MNVPLISEYLKRRNRYRLRAIIRGHRVLKQNNQLGLIREIKRELAGVQIRQVNKTVSELFFGEGYNEAELIVRQYLVTRVGGVQLNKALLYSIGSKGSPVVYPLPKEFQSVLIDHGFKISVWRCSVLWIVYIGLLWCYGVLSIAKHFYDAFRNIIRPVPLSIERVSYFFGLTKNNLPQPYKDGLSHDVVTWYANWKGSANSLTELRHSVRDVKPTLANGQRVEFVEHAIPPLNNISSLIRFVRWTVIAVSLSAIDIFRGRWWNALLLSETAKAEIVRLTKPNQLACDYLFCNTDTIYRPIWTYEAIKKGSRIISYFYSTFEDFKIPAGYQLNSTYWKIMNWPLYLVWDKYQEDLIRRSVGELGNVSIVGPIWFASSAIELPEIRNNSIAVFDIQPIRISAHFGFSTMVDLNYSNPRVPIKFIQDIDSVVSMCGGAIVHKRKRSIGNSSYKGYRSMIEKLSRNDRFISIEPDTSPIRVIENCRAVISMPFTSTAILGRELGKPSVYYDPTGALQKDDRGAHGIPILSEKDELQSWISSVLSQHKADNL